MNIEKEIFKKYNVDFNKLKDYGFRKENNKYVYEQDFFDKEFKAIIYIDDKGNVIGKVIDLQLNEEYLGLRTENLGEFSTKVREEYKKLLVDIKIKCFVEMIFISDQANRINTYIKNKYGDNPEFLWSKFPGYAVYRNKDNKKWYGIIMNLNLSKISNEKGEVEIINIKINNSKINKLINKKGFYPAYHMNKKDWISIVLNDTLKDSDINSLIDESYNLISEPNEWIIPANPKYYDITNAFNNNDEIIWKQSSDIHVNDIVYLYVASPYSMIMYKCKVTEVNIPYDYSDENINIKKIMKIKLIDDLVNKNYNFEFLNDLGIKAIRGPRKIDKKISNNLK